MRRWESTAGDAEAPEASNIFNGPLSTHFLDTYKQIPASTNIFIKTHFATLSGKLGLGG